MRMGSDSARPVQCRAGGIEKGKDMNVIDFREAAARQGLRTAWLDMDDVLSRGSQDLGLDEDSAGFLVLTEGEDLD